MLGSRKEQARFQSSFYRDSYYKVLKAQIIACVIILLLIAAIIYFIVREPPLYFYATTLGGQIVPMAPAFQQ